MFRIDNPTAVPAAPALPGPSTPGYFTNGNPSSAVAATIVDDWWLNQIQEEILAVIGAAGLTPSKADTTQLLQALRLLAFAGKTPIVAATDFYVATTGNDTSGNGSAGAPWATLPYAYNWIVQNTVNLGGYPIRINLAAGTYTAGLNATVAPLSGPVQILGPAANPAAVVINVANAHAIWAQFNAVLDVEHLTLQASGTTAGGSALVAAQGGTITFDDVVFNACDVSHIFASFGGQVRALTKYAIHGGAQQHILATSGATVIQSPVTSDVAITLTGTPNFSSSFNEARDLAYIYSPRSIFTGSATGSRYSAIDNAVIQTLGKGATAFPGNAAGTVATGGIYA
jgi:hypothetical protein